MIPKSLQNQIIRSSMYMHFYDSLQSFHCFDISSNLRLFFIANSKLVHKIVTLETNANNPYTVRWQAFKHNQALLEKNPVSMAYMNQNENYVKEQYRLFTRLAQNISFENVIINQMSLKILSDTDISSFVMRCIAQTYIPMLLGVEPSYVLLHINKLEQLLDKLEYVTGKHNVKFYDVLQPDPYLYSGAELEEQYIRLFYSLIIDWTGNISTITTTTPKEVVCEKIVGLLSESNIMRVLITVFDIHTESIQIVNNILSWIDNMLNVVYTVVNLIVLSAITNKGKIDDIFYKTNLTKCRALATMFMRHVNQPFSIKDYDTEEIIQFCYGDMIMMSNSTSDTLFGGKGRQCPSRAWSYTYMEKLLEFINERYNIRLSRIRHRLVQDSKNNSWFWNKLSTKGVILIPK